MKDITFCVKTHNRPNLLFESLRSLKKYSPDSRVIVCDDSTIYYEYPPDLSFIKLIKLDKEVGLSRGRNIMVESVDTPYTFILDDDHAITVKTKWKRSLRRIPKEWNPGIIGWPTKHRRSSPAGGWDFITREYENGLIILLAPCSTGKCEVLVNNFIANTEILKNHPWPNDLIMHEHAAFFWLIRDSNISINVMPDRYSWLHMRHNESKDINYARKRRNPDTIRRLNEFWRLQGAIKPPCWISRRKIQITNKGS